MDKKIKYQIISSLRKIWLQSSIRREAVKDATQRMVIGECKNGNLKYLNHIECNACKQVQPEKDKDYQVDHINPVVNPTEGFRGWDQYITRLLDCSTDDLQVLCKRCHKIKTKREKS